MGQGLVGVMWQLFASRNKQWEQTMSLTFSDLLVKGTLLLQTWIVWVSIDKSSHVNFMYLAECHKSHIFLKGFYNLNSIGHPLFSDPSCLTSAGCQHSTHFYFYFVIKSALKLPHIQSMNVIWTKTMWKCLWYHSHTETTLWDSAVDINACQSHSYPLYRKNIHTTGSLFGHKDAFLLFPFLITNQFNLLNGYKAGTTSWEIDQSMYSIQHHLFLLCSR